MSDEPRDQRRRFILSGAALAAASAAASGIAAEKGTMAGPEAGAGGNEVSGADHWVTRQADGQPVRLYLWRKTKAPGAVRFSTPIVFVHGSSTAGRASYDLQVPGKPDYSAMDWFARRGFDTWTFDHEGYGRSDKSRPVNADVDNGVADLEAVVPYILKTAGAKQVMMYGLSSGSLRAGLYAQRHPQQVNRLVLDALVWTGEGSPTLAERRTHLDQWRASNRRPLNRAMVESIFTRDHPGTADPDVVRAFADALLAQDDSVPTGTYLDMCVKLPLIDPKQITMPVLIHRGQFDGIAALPDVNNFFMQLPNADRQLAISPGIAHSSLHEKNHMIVLHTLAAFFEAPAAVYRM